jgi:hypothetical protein
MPPSPSARLAVNSLEGREMPAVLFVETFDAVAVGKLPATFSSWQSDPSASIGASIGRSVSGATGVTAAGNSRSAARTWQTTALPADGRAAVSLLADTLSPASVFVRGKALDTTKPSYYAATLVRGVDVKLTKVVDGVETVLGTVKSKDYVSGKWIRLTVDAVGTSVRMGVKRLDTNQWLTPTGTWQATETNAATASDAAVAGGGGAGFGRLVGTASPVTFDDFEARELSAAPPVTQPPSAPPADASPLPPTPELARKFTHIRIAQLAYSGNQVGAFEQDKLRNAVDLVIPDGRLMGAIDAAASAVPQMLYTNVSNVYLDTLRDWLDYADRTKQDRESAFYHVTAATPWQGNSPSSIPVTWLWNVQRGKADGSGTPTDLTAAARGGRSFGVAFGTTGDAITLGYTEKFRELNVTIAKAAEAGYAGAWEYASAVNAAGAVTAWKTLNTLTNTTDGLKRTGQLTFEPPADWVAGTAPGSSQRLFSVRFRTTAGTAALAPEAKTIFGRDYAGANGTIKGTIPAFDATADQNGDGSLTDAEYATRKPGFDARFAYESRLFYPYYGQQRYVINPSAPAVRGWAADTAKRQLAASPLADGLFVDNSNGKLPFAGTAVKESIANYTADSASLVGVVWKAIAPKLVLANTVGSRAEGDVVAGQAPAVLEEFLLRPSVASWTTVDDVAALVKTRLAAASSPYVVLDSHPGTTATTDPRTQVGTLAYYYLMADANRTMLMFFGGYKPSAAWQETWVKAAETDVGPPAGAMRILAKGQDPQNLALEYRVYARDYGKALVMYKPRSYVRGGATGTTDDATATTHELGGNYRALNADGTLGPTVTRITLRNGEGAVLMKA